jgi:hypothetical protein
VTIKDLGAGEQRRLPRAEALAMLEGKAGQEKEGL